MHIEQLQSILEQLNDETPRRKLTLEEIPIADTLNDDEVEDSITEDNLITEQSKNETEQSENKRVSCVATYSGSHKCKKCGKPCHAMETCSITDPGCEGFGSGVVCNR
ncbi:hypothetical protein Ddc_11579 [Ditylenchus destructor]|nr:hypothetical protein Ddc_11579 [Ditylenchus destructor]